MPKTVPRVAVERVETAKLWDLAFKVRADLARDLDHYREGSPVKGEIRLLGSIMAELRSRSRQGTLSV